MLNVTCQEMELRSGACLCYPYKSQDSPYINLTVPTDPSSSKGFSEADLVDRPDRQTARGGGRVNYPVLHASDFGRDSVVRTLRVFAPLCP